MDTRLMRIVYACVVVLVLFAAASCRGESSSNLRTLKDGDDLQGMVVTTGIANAPPLEAFCIFEIEDGVADTADCRVPALSRLAIGHMVSGTNKALQGLDWSKLIWRVELDGYPLDLDSFGIRFYTEPALRRGPSPIREVFMQRKTWDIVLIHPTVGLHTLRTRVWSGSGVYEWAVNFMIGPTTEPLDAVDRPAVRTPSSQFRNERLYSDRFN